MKYIARDELAWLIENNEQLTVVEALGEMHWKDAHIPGALQMDHTEAGEKADKLLPDKDARIVVYCADEACQNSVKAVRALEDMGYTSVYEYAQGKQDWIEAGLPVESLN